ncbi:MAG: hypothetical protein WDO16_04505 [Bacteroidota bacterium]
MTLIRDTVQCWKENSYNVEPQRKPTLAMRQYVTAQTVFTCVLLFVVALFEHYLSVVQLILLSLFIIVSLINSGAILDQRRWIFYLEYIRVILVLIAIAVFYPNNWAFSAIMGVLLVMIWYFRPMQRYYLHLLYTNSRS